MRVRIPGFSRYEIDTSDYLVYKNRETYPLSYNFSNGYPRVFVKGDDGESRHELLHRLVAKTFCPNPDNLPIVMHLDNNKLNWHPSNLKFGTIKENTIQARDDGLLKYTGKWHEENKKYYAITNHKDIVVPCHGLMEVANTLGCSRKIADSRRHHGYVIKSGKYKGCTVESRQLLYRVIDSD